MILKEWLDQHSISEADTDDWNLSLTDSAVQAPVYPLSGGYPTFWVVRSFLPNQIRYWYEPLGSKTGFHLYGAWRNIANIVSNHYAVLMEGFSDVIGSHHPCAVGLMGSHVTSVQRAILEIFTNEVVCWGDGDEAGEKLARFTGTSRVNYIGVQVQGRDPAAFAADGGDVEGLVLFARQHASIYSHLQFNEDGSALIGATER